MKLKRYVILDNDNKEISRGKMTQKARKIAKAKGNKVELLREYADRIQVPKEPKV